MNFRDQPLACSVCGKTFVFTVTEQRRLYESGQVAGDTHRDIAVSEDKCPNCRQKDPATGRWSGRVKWFSQEKGYGFIVKPDAGEVFFHRSQVVDGELVSIQEGASVTFEQVATDRGTEAQRVQVESAQGH